MPSQHLKTMSHMETTGIRLVNKIGMRSTKKDLSVLILYCFNLCTPTVSVKMMISGNGLKIFSDNIIV